MSRHSKTLSLQDLGFLGSWLPEGDAAETVPRRFVGGSTAPAAGVLHLVRMWIPNGKYSQVKVGEGGTAPSVVANSFIGIFDTESGNKLAESADFTASLAANTLLTIPFINPLVVNDPDGGIEAWFGLLIGSATTMPTFLTAAPSQAYQFTDQSLGPQLGGRHNTAGLTAIPSSVVYNGSNVLGLWALLLG